MTGSTLPNFLAQQDGEMLLGRSDHTTTLLENNNILIYGGCIRQQTWNSQSKEFACDEITDKFEIFTPSKDKKGSNASELLVGPRKRYRHAAVRYNKNVYFFGGLGDDGSIVSSIDVYNTETGAFDDAITPPADFTASADLSAFVYSDNIYIVSGWHYDATKTVQPTLLKIYGFDPQSKKFLKVQGSTDLREFCDGACQISSNGARTDHQSVVSGEAAYIIGGFENSPDTPLNVIEKWTSPGSQDGVFSKLTLTNDDETELDALQVGRGDKGAASIVWGGENYLGIFGGEIKRGDGQNTDTNGPDDKDTATPTDHVEFINIKDTDGDKVPIEFAGKLREKLFRFPVVSLIFPGDEDSTVFAFGGQKAMEKDGDKYFHPITKNVERLVGVDPTDDKTDAAISTTAGMATFVATALGFFF